MEEAKGDKPKHLNFIDPELFEPTKDHAKFNQIYECSICSGVVMKPLECSTDTCATLYCEKCINALKNKECPMRCGSKAFHKPNKHVMNQLNEFRFKCQNQPMCPEVIPYQFYEKHFAECNVDLLLCDKPQCKALKQQVIDLISKVEELKQINER